MPTAAQERLAWGPAAQQPGPSAPAPWFTAGAAAFAASPPAPPAAAGGSGAPALPPDPSLPCSSPCLPAALQDVRNYFHADFDLLKVPMPGAGGGS